ncbi:MAG: TonB-dependent receptor [Tannerella sp.]|jgi:TonB-linked SusC/RagA family outer membrane protein|nr:TonB-dependent receptor [Tannerella sp.]
MVNFRRTIEVIRLTSVFLFIGMSFCYATSSYSQETYLTVKLENKTVKDVFREIEKKSEYIFFYYDDVLDVKRKVSVRAENQTVDKILDQLFKGTDNGYVIRDRQIFITRKEMPVAVVEEMIQQQQGKPVSGKVTDVNGEPLIGVNVVEKGTTNGIPTDVDGNFTITVNNNAVLVVSYIGYATQEIAASLFREGAPLNIKLLEDYLALEEVVVVGYGTQKKVNLSGAVQAVSGKTLENRTVSNANLALQGAAANLNIEMSSGRANYAPDINIRGYTSINGGSAFILVDNVPVSPAELARINPSDIESVSVLKDASASAIYGARAAFGVVLITTKTAKSSKLDISADATYGIREWYNMPDLVTDVVDFMQLTYESGYPLRTIYDTSEREYAAKVKADPTLPRIVFPRGGVYSPTSWGYYYETNWQDVVYNTTAATYNANVRVAQQNDKGSYMVSAGYYQQDGIVIYENAYKRYNVRANGDFNLTKWWNVGSTITLATTGYNYPSKLDHNLHGLVIEEDAVYPLIPNPDGTQNKGYADLPGMLKDGGRVNNDVTEVQASFNTKLDIVKDVFAVKADANFRRYYSTVDKGVYPSYYRAGENDPVQAYYADGGSQSWASSTNDLNFYTVYNIYGDFHKTFAGKHFVSAVAGFNQELLHASSVYARHNKLFSTSLPSIQLAYGDMSMTEAINELALRGTFYRLNYIFDNKYIAEFSGRYDGSSRFPKADRFGFFPSGSLAWVLSREKFAEELAAKLKIDQLKLRGSYGTLGNQINSNYYPYLATMGSGLIGTVIDGEQPMGVYQPTPVAGNLTWEQVRTVNGGIDLTMLNNRLDVSFDIYTRYTEGMLTKSKQLPAFYGASEPNTNAADLKTKGWELSIGYRDKVDVGGSPLNYGVRVMLADSRSWITKFDNPNKLLSNYYEGQEIGEIWGLTTLGYFQSDDEIELSPDQTKVGSDDTKYMFYVGDLKFADINGDGEITYGNSTVDDPGDRKIIGNSSIRLPYSFTIDGDWKGFDLRMFFQGTGKRDWYPPALLHTFWGIYGQPWATPIRKNLDHWTPENPNAYFPRVKQYIAEDYSIAGLKSELSTPQTKYLQDASYIRLKNLTIGYTLPSHLTNHLRISNMRVFFSGENLFTISGIDVKEIDPEILNGEYRGSQYPLQRVYSFGLNLNF